MRNQGLSFFRGLLLAALAASPAWAQGPGAPWGSQLQQAEAFAPPTNQYDPSVVPAQYGPEMAGEYGMPPEGVFYPPGQGHPAGGYGEPSLAPWPQTSPFDHRFDQVRPIDGLWHRFINDSPRRFHAGIDYLHAWYQKPGGAGNEPDKQIGFPVRLALSGPLIQDNEDEFQDQLLDGLAVVPPDPGTIGFGVFSPRQPINDPTRIVRWSFLEDDLDSNGFEGFWGYTDPDDTGWELSGFYGGKGSQEMDIPLRAVRQGATLVNNRSADISLVVNRVKLADGTLSQVPLVFVTDMAVTYETEAWGASANYYMTPILGRDTNKVRPLGGLRYMGVHEQFDLIGRDNRPGETPLDILTPRELQALDSGFGGNYGGNTFVTTWVESQLVGPQFGLQWDLGGENLKIKTFAIGGAMANFNKIRINAQNYGAVPGPGLNVNLQENHSHISPLIDLGIQGDMPLFSYLPFINRIPVVRDGILRVGYKHTWVFLMDRPADSITWGDPTPVIDTDRETWSVRWVNLGIQWKY